jgi:hypothetical protein
VLAWLLLQALNELEYPEKLQKLLLTPNREMGVELVVQMDSGEIEVCQLTLQITCYMSCCCSSCPKGQRQACRCVLRLQLCWTAEELNAVFST